MEQSRHLEGVKVLLVEDEAFIAMAITDHLEEAGVTVNLKDAGGTVIQTTTTNGSGIYGFTNLLPGDYSVEFIPPGGYVFSPQDQGGDSVGIRGIAIAGTCPGGPRALMSLTMRFLAPSYL